MQGKDVGGVTVKVCVMLCPCAVVEESEGPAPLEDAWIISMGENTSWTELQQCVTPRVGAAMTPVS